MLVLLTLAAALAANGDYDHCDGSHAYNLGCGIGEGDCDNDAQCADDLVCGSNNGLRYGMPWNWDVCWPPHCENGVQDADETAVDLGGSCQHLGCPRPDLLAGDADYCGPECPCPPGLGGCTTDADCADGGVCAPSWGDHFGFDAALSVCVPAHCTDGVLSGDETGPDDGGACGVSGACTSSVSFADADGDSFGDPATATVTCAGAEPAGHVLVAQDCDDATPTTYPYAREECDGVDNDCDGYVDVYDVEGVYASLDLDGDGQVPVDYGDDTIVTCEVPAGWIDHEVAWPTDCDDTDPAIYFDPALPDTCEDGVDSNCDGVDGTCGDYGDVDVFAATSARWTLFDGSEWDPLVVPNPGMGPATPIDFDGDGRAELVFGLDLDYDPGVGTQYGFVVMSTELTRTGTGHLVPESRVMTPASAPMALKFRSVDDYDGDGIGDVAYAADACAVGGDGPARIAFGPFVGSRLIRSAPATSVVANGDPECGTVTLLHGGDLDGDGVRETMAEFHSPFDDKQVAVVDAPLSPGVLVNLPADARTVVDDDPAEAFFGRAITSLTDDFDGDGVADLILASDYSPGAAVLFGPVPSGAIALVDRDATLEINPMAHVGDITGDGLPDVMSSRWVVAGGAWSGALTTDDATIDFAGSDALDLGEANGDGQLDVVVLDAGDVGVHYGPLAPGTYDAVDDADLRWLGLNGAERPSEGAFNVWFVPDVDASGRDELAVHVWETNLLAETGDASAAMLFIYPL